MRKNKAMKAASLLLVLTLASSCFVGGTFAKYTTSAEGEDIARVAKWGIQITNNTETKGFFSTEYKTTDTTNYASMELTVKSSNSDKIVAPGTKGTLMDFTITGSPEVSYKVEFATPAGSTNSDIYLKKDKNGTSLLTTYYPLKYKLIVNSTEKEYATLGELASGLTEYADYYYDIKADKYYVGSSKTEQDDAPIVEVTWEWKFEVDDTTDEYDTLLGDIQAGTVNGYTDVTDYELDVSYTVDVTVTQIN